MVDTLWLDYETFSPTDIKKCGADRYARDPATEVLLVGYALNNGPAKVWDVTEGGKIPRELYPYLFEGWGQVIAFNAPFEIAITDHVLTHKYVPPQDPHRWRCAQVLAYALSFSGGLDKILNAIFPDIRKQEGGSKLINRFCKPAPGNHKAVRYDKTSHPEEWEKFKEYCVQDVEVLRRLWVWCNNYRPMTDHDWDLWALDRAINQRGLPVDLDLVHKAEKAMAREKVLDTKALHDLTGLVKVTPQPLLVWLRERGYPHNNLQKANKESEYGKSKSEEVRGALKLSLQIAQASSSSKWTAFAGRTDPATCVVRDTLQFNGAGRTARWAGRGIQQQNLKRTVRETPTNVAMILSGLPVSMGQISTSIRSAIKARSGCKLVVSDLSSIESRLAGWLTNCQAINSTFATGLDTYKVLAAALYGIPYDVVSKEQRTFAKPAALGAQYMLGGNGLVRYAEDYGVELSPDEAKHHIQVYRDLYPELPKFWGAIKAAINEVLRSRVPVVLNEYRLALYLEGEFLFIKLPSGRRLNYYRPRIVQGPAPWDETQMIEKFSFMGVNTLTTQWTRIHAHAGGILENIIQAIARDVLCVWLERVNKIVDIAPIVGHVHDEIITEVQTPLAGMALDALNYAAEEPISWAPGLLITADGYISDRYKKD